MSVTLQAPVRSPFLNANGEAVLVDPNGNHIPCVVLVHPDLANGANETNGVTVTAGQVSQVTTLQDKPTISIGGVPVPVLAVYDMASGSAALKKAGGKFASTVQTGTGSAQNVAHGLGSIPAYVLIAPYDNTASGSTPFTFVIAEGSHTSTNVVVTATSGLKFKVLAFA